MRVLILMMLASCAVAEPGYYVIGDSQCEIVIDGSADQAWPHKIQAFTGMYMKNLCKSGRLMASNNVADTIRAMDIVPSDSIKGVIIHLGTNDKMRHLLFGADLEFSTQLIDAVQEAQGRGLEVVCILPPDNGYFTTEDVRGLVERDCPATIDGSQYVGPEDMPDSAHFGPDGHRKYAEGILDEI